MNASNKLHLILLKLLYFGCAVVCLTNVLAEISCGFSLVRIEFDSKIVR